MTYKLEYFIEKIESPVIAAFPDGEKEFSSGKELADSAFEKYYLVDTISVKDNKICINFYENKKVNIINWIG